MRGIAAAIMFFTISAHGQSVYRCGSSYSHEPCQDGKVVEVAPAVSDPAGAKTKLIYLCRRRDKAQPWWIHEECSRRGWTVIDSARVPSNIAWDDQVAIGERTRTEKRNRANNTQSYQSAPQINHTKASTESQCQQLNQRIEKLDQMGRAGGNVRRMEWIRQERQSTRNEQFRIGC